MNNLDREHGEMVASLAKSGEDIISSMNPSLAHLLHMAVGIAGEAGEIIDAVKKAVIYNKNLDIENLVEELGDMEFYMAGLRQGLQISRELTLAHNISKLSVRYEGFRYSDEAAQARTDKVTGDPTGEIKEALKDVFRQSDR